MEEPQTAVLPLLGLTSYQMTAEGLISVAIHRQPVIPSHPSLMDVFWDDWLPTYVSTTSAHMWSRIYSMRQTGRLQSTDWR